MTADQLKQEALDELAGETIGTNPIETKVEIPLTGEVIAEIITFEQLQLRLNEATKSAVQAEASRLLSEGRFEAVQTCLNNAKNKTLELANNLPRYILLTENGQNYLVEAPKIAIKQSKAGNVTGNKAKYPDPFNLGDKIQLKSGDNVDPVIYTVTSQGLENEGKFTNNKSDITISGLVERFHVGTLGNKASKTGMAGISHNYWTKVQ